jgi:hypothetical protein
MLSPVLTTQYLLYLNPYENQQGAPMPAQNFGGAPPSGGAQAPAAAASGGGAAAPPRQRVRARRGQATDPHSIAERVGLYFIFLSLFVVKETVQTTK